MNDDRRLELERFLDGELPAPEAAAVGAGLPIDPAAARYLGELGALRRLANRHDPAAASPAAPIKAPAPRRLAATAGAALSVRVADLIGRAATRAERRLSDRPTIPLPAPPRAARWLAAVAATAASVAILIPWALSRGPTRDHAPPSIAPPVVAGPPPVPRPIPVPVPDGGESPEVAWHRWANREPRRPEVAGRALWQSAGRHRPAALEVLTLELANAPAAAAGRLQRAAAVRVAAPGGRPRPEHRHHPAPDAERRS